MPVLDALPTAVCFRVPEAGLGGIPCLTLILAILYSKVSSSCRAYLLDGVSDYWCVRFGPWEPRILLTLYLGWAIGGKL